MSEYVAQGEIQVSCMTPCKDWLKGCLCSSSQGEDLEKAWPGKKVVKVITQVCKVLISFGEP